MQALADIAALAISRSVYVVPLLARRHFIRDFKSRDKKDNVQDKGTELRRHYRPADSTHRTVMTTAPFWYYRAIRQLPNGYWHVSSRERGRSNLYCQRYPFTVVDGSAVE